MPSQRYGEVPYWDVRGWARHSKAWQGMERHGKAWQGMERHGKAPAPQPFGGYQTSCPKEQRRGESRNDRGEAAKTSSQFCIVEQLGFEGESRDVNNNSVLLNYVINQREKSTFPQL